MMFHSFRKGKQRPRSAWAKNTVMSQTHQHVIEGSSPPIQSIDGKT